MTSPVKVMVQVHLTNSELTVWWLNQDTPVAKLKGSWRGPIPPSTGQGAVDDSILPRFPDS